MAEPNRDSVLKAVSNNDGSVRLSWAGMAAGCAYTNLGDALSAVMVSALGLKVARHAAFNENSARLVSVGTIGHDVSGGELHFWGTGHDPNLSDNLRRLDPEKTFVYATRGRLTRDGFIAAGIEAPSVYGDPVWLLPSIFEKSVKTEWDLGVIVHISELTEYAPGADIVRDFIRYEIPRSLQGKIRIIDTFVDPNIESMKDKIREITSCARIVSTSLHGLVFAESYGIPCLAWRYGGGRQEVSLDQMNPVLDPRMYDLYTGLGAKTLNVFGQTRKAYTNWKDLIQAVDDGWRPPSYSPEALVNSFPLPLAYNPLKDGSFTRNDILKEIVF